MIRSAEYLICCSVVRAAFESGNAELGSAILLVGAADIEAMYDTVFDPKMTAREPNVYAGCVNARRSVEIHVDLDGGLRIHVRKCHESLVQQRDLATGV